MNKLCELRPHSAKTINTDNEYNVWNFETIGIKEKELSNYDNEENDGCVCIYIYTTRQVFFLIKSARETFFVSFASFYWQTLLATLILLQLSIQTLTLEIHCFKP